jgi:predicted dehydrogenase
MIGAGAIAEEHLKALKKHGIGAIEGICDLSPALGQFMARRHHVKKSYLSLDEMLDEVCPGVVHLLTPPATHADLIEKCLLRGANVLVEKPVALSLEEFDRLADIASNQNVHLVEDQNYRFNTVSKKMQAAVRAGRLGDLKEIEVRLSLASLFGPAGRYGDLNLPHSSYRLPCGVVHEFITHLAYLALSLWEADDCRGGDRIEVKSVEWGRSELGTNSLDANIRVGLIDIRLRFDSASAPDGFEMDVRGSKASARADIFQPCIEWFGDYRPRVISGLVNQRVRGGVLKRASWKNLWSKIGGWTPYEGLVDLVGRFYEAIEGRASVPVSSAQMRQPIQIIEMLAAKIYSEVQS